MSAGARNYPHTTPPGGYRLPGDLRLGEVRLQVADLDRSIAYYEKVIGLRIIQRTENRVSLGAQTGDKVLVELNEKRGIAAIPRRGKLGLYHFAILLPDRKALGRFVKHLADLGEYAGMADHFVSEAIYLTDPDGLGIEVYADRPRSSWKVVGRNLSMGSVHLDAEDLVRAGSDKEWDGIPEGTVIGHVHLYVDRLETGEKFYHDAVGFDKVNLEFPGALFLAAGGYHHHLGTNIWAAQSPLATNDDARLLEWTVELSSADQLAPLAQSLEANGYTVERSANAIVTTDPWTTRIRFRAQ